jgi:hypothetical protein
LEIAHKEKLDMLEVHNFVFEVLAELLGFSHEIKGKKAMAVKVGP